MMIKNLETIIQKTITSRKAMASLTIIIFSSLALWFGKLTSNDWVALIEWTLGSYLASQGIVDAVTKLKGGPSTIPQSQNPDQGIEGRI